MNKTTRRRQQELVNKNDSGRDNTRGGTPTQQQQWPCKQCKQSVEDNHLVIYCEYCYMWVHISCQYISKEAYEALKDANEILGGQQHWFCKVCNVKALDVLKLVNNLKESNDVLTKRMDKGVKELNNLAEKDSNENNLDDSDENNLDNPDESSSDERDPMGISKLANDKDIVKHMFDKVLQAGNIQVLEAKRIPEVKKYGDDKPRMILTKLVSVDLKFQALRKAKTLGSNEAWKGVLIEPDRTKAEREHHYHLRKELKQRKKQREKNVTIRSGKITTIKKGNIQRAESSKTPSEN
ncbi:hypothetical protein Pcinc_018430 [Petrolisthes cinctipes]|uniref:PHD-type domain-containing protein n=1 Tax=Petrolisthes cinctipes TaxID=88211 RepID=A0AAE1FP64_PETCI|nr:hypothetical protein Pcinc_018430 [Petrolisthes cinctipes]